MNPNDPRKTYVNMCFLSNPSLMDLQSFECLLVGACVFHLMFMFVYLISRNDCDRFRSRFLGLLASFTMTCVQLFSIGVNFGQPTTSILVNLPTFKRSTRLFDPYTTFQKSRLTIFACLEDFSQYPTASPCSLPQKLLVY